MCISAWLILVESQAIFGVVLLSTYVSSSSINEIVVLLYGTSNNVLLLVINQVIGMAWGYILILL